MPISRCGPTRRSEASSTRACPTPCARTPTRSSALPKTAPSGEQSAHVRLPHQPSEGTIVLVHARAAGAADQSGRDAARLAL